MKLALFTKRIFLFPFFVLIPSFLFAQPELPTIPEQGHTIAPSSVQIGSGLSGSYLIQFLRDYYYYTQSSGKNYDNSRQYLYSKVDISGDQVYCLYTGFTTTYDSTSQESASTQVYLNGSGINAEHLWPQSKFDEKGPMVFDLHHLFAAKVQPNGDRSDFPFISIEDENEVKYWYLGSDRLTAAPVLENQHLYSKFKNASGFEPRDQTKGDVARALFYFYSMYKDNANMLNQPDNADFFNEMKNTLLAWHRFDPADDFEKERNNKVEHWQQNRNPFIDDSSLVARVFFSPDAISSTFAGNNEGWRMASLPFNTSYEALYSSIWTQGINGASYSGGNPTIYFWDTQNGIFTPISDMSATAGNQLGHIIYLFNDDDWSTPGIQGGFPKSISIQNVTVLTSANFDLQAPDLNQSSTIDADEGWNLIQNPFDRAISVQNLLNELSNKTGKNFNENVYIWDANHLSYITLSSESDSLIAPFQSFWVKIDEKQESVQTVSLSTNEIGVSQSKNLLKSSVSTIYGNLQIIAQSEEQRSVAEVEFDSESQLLYDVKDAFYLEPLDPKSFRIYSLNENGNPYQKNVIPLTSITEEYFIPVNISDFDGEIQLRLNKWGQLDYDFFWSDNEMLTPLSSENNFLVKTMSSREETALNLTPSLYKPIRKNLSNSSAFGILIRPKEITAIESQAIEKAHQIQISEAYPNPFNPNTQFTFSGEGKGLIHWQIFSVLGQQIQSGEILKTDSSQLFRVDLSRQVSGIYFIRFTFGNQMITKKLTLVK